MLKPLTEDADSISIAKRQALRSVSDSGLKATFETESRCPDGGHVMFDLLADEPQVLVVDDIPATREIIRDMLQEMGFNRIIEAGDGREALEKLKESGAQLIICDYMMKDMSGLDLLSQLRNHPYLVDIPFIVVSAVGDVPVIETALELGASDYIVKPVSYQLLRRKISDVLRRRQ